MALSLLTTAMPRCQTIPQSPKTRVPSTAPIALPPSENSGLFSDITQANTAHNQSLCLRIFRSRSTAIIAANIGLTTSRSLGTCGLHIGRSGEFSCVGIVKTTWVLKRERLSRHTDEITTQKPEASTMPLLRHRLTTTIRTILR